MMQDGHSLIENTWCSQGIRRRSGGPTGEPTMPKSGTSWLLHPQGEVTVSQCTQERHGGAGRGVGDAGARASTAQRSA
jgi:hypothetical protein